MDTLSSKEFRRQYARLTEPTVVTVNGHPLGTWLPARFVPVSTNDPTRDTAYRQEFDTSAVEFHPAPKPKR
jgi:hypothetical protein